MTTFQFATKCSTRAKEMLNHESFNHISQEQKEFILANLGKVRVMDPLMHGGGKLSFEDSQTMMDFLKIYVPNPDSFMFNHQYISLSKELVSWGLDQGFTSYKYALSAAVNKNHSDLIDLYIQRGIHSKEEAAREISFSSSIRAETILKFVETHGPTKFNNLWCLKDMSAQDAFSLIEKKIISHKGLMYSNRELYNKIVLIKKNNKKKVAWSY